MHRKEEILKFLSDQHEARTQYGAGDNASQKSCNSHKQTWGFSGSQLQLLWYKAKGKVIFD